MNLVCPGCDREHPGSERFCAECGLPLVFAPGAEGPRKSELAIRARKVRPGYAEGPLVRIAAARHQAEAEMIQGLLLEEGIPSLVRRSGGFDVPDFLAAGPRDILVASSGADAAREILGDRRGERRLAPPRHPAWVRALAMTMAVLVITVFAATVALPLFN
jgi:Putative prokaryotic signal transducing protein